jgi:exodeoxyribonuclease V alpha subunit
VRGGLERWKRGAESQGVRQAIAYAFEGRCDSHIRTVSGVEALAEYGKADSGRLIRFTVEGGQIRRDALTAVQLRRWVDGRNPLTDERRGRNMMSPDSDLLLDGTINAPKSFSIAALINPDLAEEFEALQDRLRDRVIAIWQRELNARRGAGGLVREALRRVEVVELQHRRSRALDPHIHRHLWLNVRVQGEDGKWSNVDSRVAMKLQTLVNAEGELAARTDPTWIDALARHGYTLSPDGEIAELAATVRPMSRRSNQIEANRAQLTAEWLDSHPGQHPSHDVEQHIDRLAWARGRPDKPDALDEADWANVVRGELKAIDEQLLEVRAPVAAASVPSEAIDLDFLAARAIADADSRSASSSGRFSEYDLRAGAIRAVAASGLVTARDELQPLINEAVRRAMNEVTDLLHGESSRPPHIKGYMATRTVRLKAQLMAKLESLSRAGAQAPHPIASDTEQAIFDPGVGLDPGQRDAACAIAGTDALVSVTGPAGTGKTTMLRVARALLTRQRRRLIVVAPTKKAASVAAREIRVSTLSLHALLAEYGWRWSTDPAGRPDWRRLRVGEKDPATGRIYPGPQRLALRAGDRIVVDEAGMVELHSANALAEIAAETGAGIAMVGDHLQAMPVGHGGAMAILTRCATAVVQLSAVHRFHDPTYAQVTLRMREPASKQDALAISAELDRRGLLATVSNADSARALMVDDYFEAARSSRRVALVCASNDEADAINEAIQHRRLEHGELAATRVAFGRHEQRLLEGDVVQTRLNDRRAGVDNRSLWTVTHIAPDSIDLSSVTEVGVTRSISRDYAADHLHLAYASTVHGIQGETTDVSVVGPGVDASGLYVGMTRGRLRNTAIVVTRPGQSSHEALANTMLRGTPETTMEEAVSAAHAELRRAATALGHSSSQEERRAKELTKRVEQLDAWLASSSRALLVARAQNATDTARGIAEGDNESAERLRELIHARVTERDRTAVELNSLLNTLDESRTGASQAGPKRTPGAGCSAPEPVLHGYAPSSPSRER